MTDEQRDELSKLWDAHMDAMKRFLATGKTAALDEAERIAEQMKQLRLDSNQ